MFGEKRTEEKENNMEKITKTKTRGAKTKTRLIVNAKKNPEVFKKALRLLEKANDKSRGKPVEFADLAALALGKVSTADIEKLKGESLSSMDRVRESHLEYNKNNGTELSLGEFLARKLEV